MCLSFLVLFENYSLAGSVSHYRVGWAALIGKEKNRILGGIERCAAALKSTGSKEKLHLLPFTQGDNPQGTDPTVCKAGICAILYVRKYRRKTATKPEKVHGLTGAKVIFKNRNKNKV